MPQETPLAASSTQPLAGITVVEIGQNIAAPSATQILADLGARVIKIEKPQGDDARAQRDRALLLIGWAGGFRSSELVGLDWSDVEEVREGLVLHLRRSKTDQLGQGRKIGIPLGRTRHCPVSALAAWRKASGGDDGPIFRPVDRHGHIQPDRLRSDAVSTILRDRLTGAGIDCKGYSGHSLRAGLATSAIKAGVPTYKIRAQTGHASDLMLARYLRDAGMFDGNAAGALL